MQLVPGGVMAWMVAGLVAGWLAGTVMRGRGFGLNWDLIIGLVGAVVCGLAFSSLLPGGGTLLIGSVVAAFIGAVALLAVLGALSPRRRRFLGR